MTRHGEVDARRPVHVVEQRFQVDGTQWADQGDTRQTLGHAPGTSEGIGSTAGDAKQCEAIKCEMVRKCCDIRRPVRNGSGMRWIRVSVAWAIRGDDPDS